MLKAVVAIGAELSARSALTTRFVALVPVSSAVNCTSAFAIVAPLGICTPVNLSAAVVGEPPDPDPRLRSPLVRRTVPLWVSSASFAPALIGRLKSGGGSGEELNVAVVCLSASMVSWQGPLPEQAPLQPPKLEPPAGMAVRMTCWPSG